ncbi:MAG: ATP-binding cassette domain-containing protein [Mobilicoccus sp.]|nr:ATP-binding cassette domain-containing protein [Mobilicoccus sp.]
MSAAVIDLLDASFGYGERPVVTGATLCVNPGERVAVVGANGSGKSTLVKGLLGLNDHLGGRVTLFGTPLARFKQRHLLGYVPQRHTLSASVAATAGEIVASGRLPHLGVWGRPGRGDRAIISESLELVGLGDRENHEVSTFSGGQQRRVLIARALAGGPKVLIMDEPTAGVDAASQRQLAGVLARLADAGVTLVVVTHEIAPLTGVLSRVVTVEAGRVRGDTSLTSHLSTPVADLPAVSELRP